MSAPEGHISQQFANYQEFLDNHQYSREGILSYEKVFGRTYVSTGGEKTTREFCSRLDLQPGQEVLDICCGIGGSAFYMAKTFGVRVTGVDLSTNMLSIARERQQEMGIFEEQVKFMHGDITKTDFPEATFDLVYTRDALMHISDKPSLLTKILTWLKPGGKLLISDYCAPPVGRPWSEGFSAYVKQRGYFLLSVETYVDLLRQAGFVNVKGSDEKEKLVQSLRRELQLAHEIKEDFLKSGLKEESFQDILDGWKIKIVRAEEGEHVWGLFLAEKAG